MHAAREVQNLNTGLCCRARAQLSVLDFIGEWLEQCWYDYHGTSIMTLCLVSFLNLVKESGKSPGIAAVLTTAKEEGLSGT